MNRFLTTTATIALCTAWTLTGAANADDAATPATPQATTEDSEPKTMQEAINIQVQNAKTLRLQGKIDGAGKALSQLMLVAPDDPVVVAEYGKTLAQQGRSQDAVNFLTQAAQMQPGDWTIFSALGVAYDQLDKRKEARVAYDRALALKPGEPSVINNYAVSRMLAGDYEGARKMLEQAQASGLSDPKIAGNLAKVEELQAVHPQAATSDFAASDKTSAPTASPKSLQAIAASTKPPVAHGGVMMQRVPADPLAGPVAKGKATYIPATSDAVVPPARAKANPSAALAAATEQKPKADTQKAADLDTPPEPRPDGAIGIVSSLATSMFKKITGESDEPDKTVASEDLVVPTAQLSPAAVESTTSKSGAKTAMIEKPPTVSQTGSAEAREVTGAPRPLIPVASSAIAKLEVKKPSHIAAAKAAAPPKSAAWKKPPALVAKAVTPPLSAPPSLRTASDSN